MSSTMYSSRIWRGENSERSNLTVFTISEIVGKLSHMEEKIIPKSIPTLHFCIFWERE